MRYKDAYKKLYIWRLHHISEQTYLLLLSVIVGILSGLAAVLPVAAKFEEDLAELDEEKNKAFGKGRPGAANFYYGAPTVFILSAEESFKWSRLDAGIAVQNMALEAEELGLGSVIIGCIEVAMWGEKREYFDKAFKIPSGYRFEIALAVGHKAVTKEPHTFNESEMVYYI